MMVTDRVESIEIAQHFLAQADKILFQMIGTDQKFIDYAKVFRDAIAIEMKNINDEADDISIRKSFRKLRSYMKVITQTQARAKDVL